MATAHHAHRYKLGEEALPRDVHGTVNEKVAKCEASKLQVGDGAFILRSDDKWRYSIVIDVSSSAINFVVSEGKCTKKIANKHWGDRILCFNREANLRSKASTASLSFEEEEEKRPRVAKSSRPARRESFKDNVTSAFKAVSKGRPLYTRKASNQTIPGEHYDVDALLDYDDDGSVYDKNPTTTFEFQGSPGNGAQTMPETLRPRRRTSMRGTAAAVFKPRRSSAGSRRSSDDTPDIYEEKKEDHELRRDRRPSRRPSLRESAAAVFKTRRSSAWSGTSRRSSDDFPSDAYQEREVESKARARPRRRSSLKDTAAAIFGKSRRSDGGNQRQENANSNAPKSMNSGLVDESSLFDDNDDDWLVGEKDDFGLPSAEPNVVTPNTKITDDEEPKGTKTTTAALFQSLFADMDTNAGAAQTTWQPTRNAKKGESRNNNGSGTHNRRASVDCGKPNRRASVERAKSRRTSDESDLKESHRNFKHAFATLASEHEER